jgi:hypothetical protein
VNLMEMPPFLEAFNFPGGKVARGRRDTTTVPAQALALLNDPFVLEQADYWATRLIARNDRSAAERIDHLFRTALGRAPSALERGRFERATRTFAEVHGVSAADIPRNRAVWKDLAHALFNVQEFIHVP